MVVFALALCSTAVPTGSVESAEAAATPAPRVLFVGDSSVSLYNNRVGSYQRGWWSYVAAAKGWTPMKDAEYGSGYLRRGNSCTGTRYAHRLPVVSERKPDVIVVAGGRNDAKKCVAGKLVPATTAELARLADTYFDELLTRATAAGVDKVYVLSPWAGDFPVGYKIRPIIRDAAQAHGFTWISTSFIPRNYTTDGLHQNASGNRLIRDQVLAGMS
ncbi:SGNH/GDSL hydrolase family protein [Aeromicrobium sp. NPDC092404]|uniref:SGNH/GDSL hydrolase family protein n=1 Tax=Aeromicrobium sp. NPDC092404 TaxID=3154976 RepID=UPI003443570E